MRAIYCCSFGPVFSLGLICFGLGSAPVTNDAGDAMSRGGNGNRSDNGPANLAHRYIHAESGRVRKPLVEGRLGVPKARRGAGDATVARFDGPACAAVPLDGRTVQIRLGTFASHLVKAPAFARTFIVPFLDETAGVVVRSPFALVVDDIPVCKQWPVQRIERRHLSKREVVHKHGRCVGRVVWASR
jgi:hypothetical protein